MQQNPWKLATIGLALLGTTALGTGLTTAWMMRPPATATAQETATTPPAAARMAPSAPASPLTQAVQRNTTSPVTRVSTPVRPVSTFTAAECGTNGDRVMRIAKLGIIRARLGAGVGPALGPIVNVGKAGGYGAISGGLG